MLEQLRIVLEAEAEARQRLEVAREAAKHLITDAEEEARQRVRQARAAENQVASAVEAQWVEQANQKAEAVEADVQLHVQALRARAQPRLERAVDLLLRHVLGEERSDGQ